MSWDIAIAKFDPPPSDFEELAEARELPLGKPEEVQAILADHFPGLAWGGGNATWGEGKYLGVEFCPDRGRGKTIKGLTMMVSFGGASDADVKRFLSRLHQMLKQHGWTAIDAGSGEIVEE